MVFVIAFYGYPSRRQAAISSMTSICRNRKIPYAICNPDKIPAYIKNLGLDFGLKFTKMVFVGMAMSDEKPEFPTFTRDYNTETIFLSEDDIVKKQFEAILPPKAKKRLDPLSSYSFDPYFGLSLEEKGEMQNFYKIKELEDEIDLMERIHRDQVNDWMRRKGTQLRALEDAMEKEEFLIKRLVASKLRDSHLGKKYAEVFLNEVAKQKTFNYRYRELTKQKATLMIDYPSFSENYELKKRELYYLKFCLPTFNTTPKQKQRKTERNISLNPLDDHI